MGVKRLLVAALLAMGLFTSPAPAVRAAEEPIIDFSGGLNTWQSPLLLEPKESPSLENVLLDERSAITRRKGYSKFNATALGDGSTRVDSVYQLEQSAGTRYCVAFSSTNAYASTDACQSFTSFASTLTRNNAVNCDAHNDRLYCVNNQYNFYYNGTHDVPVSGMPAALDYIRVHRNRCFVAGATGALSRLYYSALGDCTSWSTSTDFIDISAEDGDIITGLGEPLFDGLPIYKKFSTWVLRGATPATWVLINISKNTGAKNHRTIANFNNVQLFDSVGPNGGKPGIYGLDGIVVREVSQKLRNEIDLIDSFKANAAQRLIDTRADWEAGTFDAYTMSAVRESGFMQSSYTSVSHTLGADWTGGTFTNVSTTSVDGSLTLVQGSTASFINAGAEIGTATVENNWTAGSPQPFGQGSLASGDFLTALWGSKAWITGNTSCSSWGNLTYKVQDGSGNDLKRTIVSVTNDMDTTFTIYTATLTTQMVKLFVNWDTTADFEQVSVAFIRGDGVKIRIRDDDTINGSNDCRLIWDIDESTFPLTGSYTSTIVDTGISTPVFGSFGAYLSSGAVATLVFNTQSSTASDGGGFESLVAQDLTYRIAAAARRYLRYNADWHVNTTTNTPAEILTASVEAASTGTWASPELTLGLSMTTWGLFQTVETKTGGGAIGYSIQASTYAGGAQYAGKVTVTPGSAITSSTGAYVIISGTYTIVSGSETSKTDSITLNWNEGTQAVSATAKVFDGRYHYAAQSNGGTRNDVMYVFDSNGAWTKWTGVRPAFLNVVNQNFVMADSSTSGGGFVFKLYDTDSDNGSPISAFWESKDLALNGIQKIKALDRVYTVHSADDSTVTMTLKADGGLQSTAYDLDFSTGAAFGIKQTVVEPSIQGNTLRIRYSNNAASKPWEVLGLILDYRDQGLMP